MQRTFLHDLTQRIFASKITLSTAVIMAISAIFSGTACDTTAEIAFPEIKLSQMYTIGALQSDNCSATDNILTFQFGLNSTNREDAPLIKPGIVVSGELLTLGESFGWQDVLFSNTVIYPSPDVTCTTDADCVDVGAGFTCQPMNSAREGHNICGRTVELLVEQNSLEYVEPTDTQNYMLSMYYGGTLLGSNPESHLSLDERTYPEPTRNEWKSDQNSEVSAGALTLFTLLAGNGTKDSEVCISSWSSDGSAFFMESRTDCFTPIGTSTQRENNADDRDQINSLSNPNSNFERALWSSILSDVGVFNYSGEGANHLIVYTDGVDTSLAQTPYTDALNAARDAGIHVHFVHLDNLAYLEGFEDIYSGPLGGSDEMARVACETGGSYQLATVAEDAKSIFRNLGYTLPGHFEIRLRLEALQRSEFAVGAYRIATTVRVTLHEDEKTFEFRGDVSAGEFGQLDDRRLVVFKR